jgi:SAM-dependent methyltransferase
MSDVTERFSNRAEDYAKFRPAYPAAVVDAVLDGFLAPIVADIGAGTGIASHLLAERAKLVYAVEPNPPMRMSIAPHPRIRAVEGTAEATTLDDGAVDVAAAFQALHWFDRKLALREFARIVRADGRIAAIWNRRDRSDEFTERYEAVVAKYGERVTPADRASRTDSLLDEFDAEGFANARIVTIRHRLPLNWQHLIGFVRSCSYLPRSGSAYDAMEAELRELFLRWEADGKNVSFALIADAYLAERQ